MENKKPPLWARIIGKVVALVALVADNVWMLLAIGWFAYGDVAVSLFCVVFAFYVRMTQIRDKIASPEFTLTINKTEQQVAIEGEKA